MSTNTIDSSLTYNGNVLLLHTTPSQRKNARKAQTFLLVRRLSDWLKKVSKRSLIGQIDFTPTKKEILVFAGKHSRQRHSSIPGSKFTKLGQTAHYCISYLQVELQLSSVDRCGYIVKQAAQVTKPRNPQNTKAPQAPGGLGGTPRKRGSGGSPRYKSTNLRDKLSFFRAVV